MIKSAAHLRPRFIANARFIADARFIANAKQENCKHRL
jgi:hypothetical protein